MTSKQARFLECCACASRRAEPISAGHRVATDGGARGGILEKAELQLLVLHPTCSDLICLLHTSAELARTVAESCRVLPLQHSQETHGPPRRQAHRSLLGRRRALLQGTRGALRAAHGPPRGRLRRRRDGVAAAGPGAAPLRGRRRVPLHDRVGVGRRESARCARGGRRAARRRRRRDASGRINLPRRARLARGRRRATCATATATGRGARRAARRRARAARAAAPGEAAAGRQGRAGRHQGDGRRRRAAPWSRASTTSGPTGAAALCGGSYYGEMVACEGG